MTDFPTQNPYSFIYLKPQKGSFQEEHPCTGRSREHPHPRHPPWRMTIVFLFCSKGMSLFYSFYGVALWFCGSSLRQSGTNQEEFFVYLLAEYHIDCLQLPRLSQSPSLLISGSGGWPTTLAFSLPFTAENIKNLSLVLCTCEKTWSWTWRQV